MKIWRKDSTKPIKDNKAEEFTDIMETSTPKENKKDKMEEIYSTKDKHVKYKRLTPLEAEAQAKRMESNKQKLTSGKAEIKLSDKQTDEKIVELVSEHEEGTVIAEDIIENVEQLSSGRNVTIQDIDNIDIDIDPNVALKKYERQVNSKERYDERQKVKGNEFERVFGKPQFFIPSQRVVAKIPTYQHESKINHIHLKAGRFTDVVESEYDEYLKSNDPIISKRPEHIRNIEPKQSLLYTLSQLANQKSADKSDNQPADTADKQSQKKSKNKIRKFFHILLLLLMPKHKQSKTDKPDISKTQTIDYQNRQDAKFVFKEISENLKKLCAKSIALLCLFLVSLILLIMERTSGASMFGGSVYTPLIYCGINLLILIVTGIISKSFIISGLKPLKSFKGNSDTAVSAAYIACLIQQIVGIFFATSFVGAEYHLYTTIVTLGFALNTIGRAIMVSRVKSNFKFLTSKSQAHAAKIYNDEDTARKMLSGTTASRSVVAYQHKTSFLSDFLKISYAPDQSEEICGKLAPITLVSSLFVGVIYGIMNTTFIGALCALTVMCCIGIPICALLAGNVPMKLFSKDMLSHNAMVSGYPSIRQFSDCDAVMVTAHELYPKGSIKLHKIEHFVEHRVDESLLSAAMILKEADSPLQHIFDNFMQDHAHILPKVESVMYEDKLGLVGWVGGERVLIGNRKLLDRYHVYIGDLEDEHKYTKRNMDVTYVACSGQLVSMIVASYTPEPKVHRELLRAQHNSLCLLVSTTDSNITADKISSDFGIYYRTIKILSTGYMNTCADATSRKEDTSRAYLATRGHFTSLMHAITGCTSLRNNMALGLIIQIFGLILGVLLTATMVLYAGVSILGVIEMLLYMMFWCIATIAAQLIRKP